MANKDYICECGRRFENPQQFNGHKSNCQIHQINKHGSLDLFSSRHKNSATKISESLKQFHKDKKQRESEQWILEQHICEKCGTIMTEKFGSGRFCCRECANSRERSEQTKLKISMSVKNSEKSLLVAHRLSEICQQQYIGHEAKCVICNANLPYEKRNAKTCSKQCYSELLRQIRLQTINRLGSNCTRCYFGFYKGYECDSSWELAYLMFCLDNNITIQRNHTGFAYRDKDEKDRTYYPDFIVNDTYIEIKGEYNEDVEYKLRDFPKDVPLKIIDINNISPYLKYARITYGKEFYNLYDSDRRSWKDCRETNNAD